jgi:hypothetical protein
MTEYLIKTNISGEDLNTLFTLIHDQNITPDEITKRLKDIQITQVGVVTPQMNALFSG